MKQLLDLCASIIEGTETPNGENRCLNTCLTVQSDGTEGKVYIDTNDAILSVETKNVKVYFGVDYKETTVNLKQYTERPPVEVIEELTNIALKEWSECNSEYLIDNKIKNLLKK